MLTRTLAAFAAHPGMTDILVVIHPDDVALYEQASAPYADALLPAVTGGARRQDSVRLGLEALARNAPSYVLISRRSAAADEALILGESSRRSPGVPAPYPVCR